MKTQREKKLEIALLKEKLERVSNKKVLFKEKEDIRNLDTINEMAYGSDYEPKVINYLKSVGEKGATAKELTSVFPTQTMSIPVLQRLLKSGKVVRDMSVRPGRWYSVDSTPEGFEPTPLEKKKRKSKTFTSEDEKNIETLLKRINRNFEDFNFYQPKEGTQLQVEFFSGLRGPRTDHGGGEDGDGWMSNEQINKISKGYFKQLKPEFDRVVRTLKDNKFKVVYKDMDYGEKGHVYFYFKLNK